MPRSALSSSLLVCYQKIITSGILSFTLKRFFVVFLWKKKMDFKTNEIKPHLQIYLKFFIDAAGARSHVWTSRLNDETKRDDEKNQATYSFRFFCQNKTGKNLALLFSVSESVFVNTLKSSIESWFFYKFSSSTTVPILRKTWDVFWVLGLTDDPSANREAVFPLGALPWD